MPYRITCAVCGRVFLGGISQRSCSRRCAGTAQRDGWHAPTDVPPPEWVRPAKAPALELRPCARCGTRFSTVNRHHPGRYCSVRCRVLAESEAVAQRM
jgi:hypothetical protein